MPVHLRELDGHEFATIQRELSTVPGLIFDSTSPELPKYIRSDCLEHYWKFFHPSFPIVYKPNFVSNTPPPLLLSAVLAIGSFYDSRPDAKLYSLALQEIATKLLRQRENITSRSRIADLQTVLLLEILSRYCARHPSPETSARFRALYASLHQTRQMMSQSPLAVFKTLKDEKSEKELEVAHKYWLENEAKRRIFHACSVLDSQQVTLFDQRPTIVVHPNAPTRLPDPRGVMELPCDEELWEASPFVDWSEKAAIAVVQEASPAVPRDINVARRDYQKATVSDYSFFQHQIINVNQDILQRCSDEVPSPPQGLSKTRFNYHIFQMAKHVPVRHLLVVTGESWLLGRKVEQETDYNRSKSIVREWINQARSLTLSRQASDCLIAHWHALEILRIILDPKDSAQPFRTTNMLHEDWAVYLATLVCWAHGYGRSTTAQIGTVPAQADMTSPSMSRKRKSIAADAPPLKRRAIDCTQTTSHPMLAPSSVANTHPMPTSSNVPTYADPNWSMYGSVGSAYVAPWSDTRYYDPSITVYITKTSAETSPATHASSSAATSTAPMTRTATNTPQSQSSWARTAATTNTQVSDSLSELKAYLSLTDVPAPQALASLDSAVLMRTKGVLDTIRIHKIGGKRVVGGLMNDAANVLSRLAENRSEDMF